MQILYWQSNVGGRTSGTITCKDGHVKLAGIPTADIGRIEAVVRDLCNELDVMPPMIEDVSRRFTSLGMDRLAAFSPILAFGTLPPDSLQAASVPQEQIILPKTVSQAAKRRINGSTGDIKLNLSKQAKARKPAAAKTSKPKAASKPKPKAKAKPKAAQSRKKTT